MSAIHYTIVLKKKFGSSFRSFLLFFYKLIKLNKAKNSIIYIYTHTHTQLYQTQSPIFVIKQQGNIYSILHFIGFFFFQFNVLYLTRIKIRFFFKRSQLYIYIYPELGKIKKKKEKENFINR